MCSLKLLWNAHFASSTVLVNTLSSAHFLVLRIKPGVQWVRWSRVMMKAEETYFHDQYDIWCKKYSQCVLVQTIGNGTC